MAHMFVSSQITGIYGIMLTFVILAWTFAIGVNGSCQERAAIPLDDSKIATMCHNSTVTGTQVFIDTDVASTTTITNGVVCTCSVTVQSGKSLGMKAYFSGSRGDPCGNRVQFEHSSFDAGHTLEAYCDNANEDIATHTYTDLTVKLDKDESGNANYCLLFDLAYCEPEQFQCNDKPCLPAEVRCDGFPDCADDSDEYQCVPSSCNEGTIWCAATRTCQLASQTCDNTGNTGTGTADKPPLITITCYESAYLPTTAASTTTTPTTTTTTPTTTTTTPTTTTTTPTTTTTTPTTTTTTPTTTTTTPTTTTTTPTTTTTTPTTTTTTPTTTTTTPTTTTTTPTTTTTTPTTTTTTPTTTTTTPTTTTTTPTTTTTTVTTPTTTTTTPTTTTKSTTTTTTTTTTPSTTTTTKTTPSSTTTTKIVTTQKKTEEEEEEDNMDIIITGIVTGIFLIFLIFLAIICFVRRSSWYERNQRGELMYDPSRDKGALQFSNHGYADPLPDSASLTNLPDVYQGSQPTHKWYPAQGPGVVHVKMGTTKEYILHQ